MARHDCVECGRPVMVYNPRWKNWVAPAEDHDLCRQCWKSERDRTRPVQAAGTEGEVRR